MTWHLHPTYRSLKKLSLTFCALRHARTFNSVSPWPLGPELVVPENVSLPEYVSTPFGVPSPVPKQIEIKTPDAVAGMRRSCRLVVDIMDSLAPRVVSGVTTAELDAFLHETIVTLGAYPSPLKYRNFPRSSCISVNNVVCHGIPDTRCLEDGDVLSVDVTVFFNGFHGDHCRTFEVGSVDDAGRRLVEGARRCRDAGVAVCGPGVKFNAIGEAIENLAWELGFTLVPYFNGHGIGTFFHGPPDVKHYRNASDEGIMRPGMTFTVEPVICEGDGDAITVLDDGWTAVTLDGSRAAQFEHTVLITENGVEVLTK